MLKISKALKSRPHNLNSGQIFMEEASDIVTNLQLQKIYLTIIGILSLGLKFHMKSRHDALSKNGAWKIIQANYKQS